MILDLFAGPGGADEGIRLAGYTGELIGVEKDADACATATAAGHHRVLADVATLDRGQFAGIDGLWGSPPCQSFSQAGKRGGLNDERGQLVWQPMEWAGELRPRWVALEQVPDVLPIWQIVAAQLRAWGYTTWTGVLNAADYGVPQVRKRAILIARRDGATVSPPATTHGRDASVGLFGDVQPWVTMADALGWGSHGPSVTVTNAVGRGLAGGSGARKALHAARDAGRWTMMSAGQTGQGRPRDPETAPADTITGKGTAYWVHERPATTVQGDARIGRPGHKDRSGGEAQFEQGAVRVTVQEAAVLQGFRADYPWQGTKTSQYGQIGNCVPPPLAAAIVRPLLASASSERAA